MRRPVRIKNVLPSDIAREEGDVVFEPKTVPGDYWIYYLPYQGDPKAHYPKLSYCPPEDTAEAVWLSKAQSPNMPQAEFERFEAVSRLHEFDDMERIATPAEVEALVGQAGDETLLAIIENRDHPVKMTRDLPEDGPLTDLVTASKAPPKGANSTSSRSPSTPTRRN